MTMKMASRLIHLINKKQIYTCCIFVSVKKVKIYSTVQKKCKRNSVFFSFFVLAKIRRISSKRSRIFVKSNEISLSSRRNFASTETKFCFTEILLERKFTTAKFAQSEILLAVEEGCNQNLLFRPL